MQMMTKINGWINLDKPLGMSSAQAVNIVKKHMSKLGVAGPRKRPGKLKIGHGGTLDPLASGVLPIAIGEATKCCGHMLHADKIYDFTICFGRETATLDSEGLNDEGGVVATSDIRPTLKQICDILPRFTGEIAQIPPQYSALKVDGKRAYDEARKGNAVTLKPRQIKIYALDICEAYGEDNLANITLRAHVSKGTYIRSLARDVARALGTVGHVAMLKRIKSGGFAYEDAISLDKLQNIAISAEFKTVIFPLEMGLDGIPAHILNSAEVDLLRTGQSFSGITLDDGLYQMCSENGKIAALVQIERNDMTILRGFNH